ncbi:MAG: hypothetical protein ACRD4R_08695 [Candidatus Acidiferrales bacterium]
MKNSDETADEKKEKPSVTLAGTVEKVIPSPHPALPEKAQIAVEEAEHMYRELRIENSLHDENGNKVSLKPGAEVDVTIEADAKGTIPKNSNGKHRGPHNSK